MNIDDYLVPAEPRAVHSLSEQEVREALDADPEGMLITDYLMGALSADQMAEVERRLREDAAFRDRVGPIIDAWKAWPTARDFDGPEDEHASNWQRLVEGAERRASEDNWAQRSPDNDSAGGSRQSASTDRRRTRRWQLVAGVLSLIGLPLAGAGGFVLARRVAPPQTLVLEAVRESKAAPLGESAWVTVEAGGRLVWDERPAANGIRELFLDGVARFDTPGATVGKYVVITPSARLILNGASARIDASDPAGTRVFVDHGQVVAASRSRTALPLLVLGPGEQGLAIWGQQPRRAR